MIDIKETDLYLPVCNYLKKNGYSVKGEVKNCDVVAMKDNKIIILELKKSFNIKLLFQGIKRQRITETVYLVVPRTKNMFKINKYNDVIYLLKRLRLGLIILIPKDGKFDDSSVKVVLHPSTFDMEKSMRRNRNKRAAVIKETSERISDTNGGSTRVKIMTSYRENSIFIACCLDKFGTMSPKQLREIGTGDKTASILYKNYYGWFIREGRGIYSLSEKGKNALTEFDDMAVYYKNKI